jgi:anhydro-N-acetylmuramic acid kinase
LNWLQEKIAGRQLAPEDIQATLIELTALSIVQAIDQYCAQDCEIFICGGGAHNQFLLKRLQHYANKKPVRLTQELGIAPDWIEAMAFAWMAKQTLEGKPSNLPEVTGARKTEVLGGIFRV